MSDRAVDITAAVVIAGVFGLLGWRWWALWDAGLRVEPLLSLALTCATVAVIVTGRRTKEDR